MSTPGAAAEALPPKCPYCKEPMIGVGAYNWTIGVWLVLSVFCVSCGVQLHMQVVHIAAIPPAAPEPHGPKLKLVI